MKKLLPTLYVAAALLLWSTVAHSQTINLSVTPPVVPAGACRQNLYTVAFSGAPSGTLLRIVPSLSGTTNSFCTTTDGTALQWVSATNATLVSDGDTLVMSINNNGNTTISYMALIDCHIAGSSSIDLNQTFLNYNGLSFLVDNDNIHTTPNLQKPDMVLQNTTGFNAYYLTPSFFEFYYRNNGDSANIRFGFTPGATAFCGQVASDSIFYQKGINGTLYPYTATDADTLQLAHLDTLIIKQRVSINACLTNCANDTAMLWWQCNYTLPQAAAFCSQCGKENYSYTVNNHDSAGIDVIRLLPARADREFSCFNDTLNAQQWHYMIVNKGKGALDSLNFDLAEWGTSGNPGLFNYLTLIDSASFSITKGVNSICTISSQMTTRVQWLCKNLVPKAMFNNQIRIKNFGQHDTVYLSFTTLRCSEENDVLLNTPKLYNQWLFKNMRTRNTCGTQTNIYSASGLFGNFISGQMIGTAFDDIDLKLQYFPSVSNLSVDNNGNGDSAVFAVQMKGLVRNSAVNIYQLLGCDTLQNFCDTLHGWLRATVFCDTNIRITRPWQDAFFIKITGGDTTFFNPEYYYTSDTIGYSICRRTTNYFYFNLADSGMRNVLDSGNFVFKIQACCGSDLSPSPYSVTFHLLPNPNNCFTLQYTGNNFAGHLTPPVINNNNGEVQWLPLSDKRKELFTLCPGCVSPGIIAHSYKMQRTASSMGLQDSDNDGRADFPPVQITDTSNWFTQHAYQINRNLSSFGDKVEDFLLANFVDGDRTNGGYDYGQLQQLGLRFNVLQLSRFIPLALDTMQLTVDSLVFYIDDTLSGGTCIDCNTFASGNGYSTLLKINAGPADVSKFLTGTSVTDNEYRYAFTSFLNGSTLSGTLHDYPTLITYTNNTFTGFMPSQHYRLHVFYSVCGNFNPVASQNIDDYVKPSQILNRFFLSGKVHHTVSHNIPQQPNSVAELDSAGWTVDSNDVNNMLVDTAFINTYAFFCEATGAQHYFAGTTYKNQSNTVNKQGCKKLLQLSASSSIAGGKGMYDAYPYEYKPPMLMPVNYNVNIPLGYYASSRAAVQNLVFLNGINTDCLSDTVALNLTDTLDNFNISYTDLPALQCLMQHNNPTGNDTLFCGDQYNCCYVNITLLPLPQWCIDTLVPPYNDTTCVVGFNMLQPSCLQGGTCNQTDLLQTNHQMNALGINPDLMQTGISNTFTLLNSDTVCWRNIKIENISSSQPAITQADHVFLALVDSSMPYLSDWHYKKGTQTIFPQGNVFALTPALALGTAVTGDLCARVVSCPADTLSHQVQVHFGWNCTGYPQSPYDSTAVCEYGVLNLSYKKATTQFYSSGKSFETPYTLCDTTTVSATFYSTQLGYVYPDSLLLQNLNPSLMVAGVSISDNGNTAQLLPTLQPWLWLFAADSMAKIGFNEGGFNNGSQFILKVDLVAGCTFSGDTTLPDFNIYAHDYCGNAVDANADYRISPVFQMSTVQSQCPDCWSIAKTASTDTTNVGDTLAYTITVCNNSVNTQTGALADNTPANFLITSSTLPATITLNSMQCDTFTISGYFAQPGSCLYNVASVTSPANTVWRDSVCVSVINVCTTTDTTFADSTFSGNATINNQSIFLANRFYINGNLTLNSCTVYTAAGAQLIVQNGGVLTLNNTTLQACDTMWRGVNVLANGKMFVQNNSKIKDADIGIFANDGTVITIDNCNIYDCVTGLFIPNKTNGYNNIMLKVNGSEFKMQSNNFKPDYIGQTPHGTLPKVGIEMGMMITTIGDYAINYFDKLNNGVVAKSSLLTVKRSAFSNIAPDLFYNEPYRGTAITSIVEIGSEMITSSLTVLPEVVNYNTVDNCYRGIYTDRSVLSANYIHLLNVTQGIFGTRTASQQTTMITNCTITSNGTGIFWVNNANARAMMATGNTITINYPSNTGMIKRMSGGAIFMAETAFYKPVVYTATNNNITLNQAWYGIMSNATLHCKIKENNIQMNQTSGKLLVTGVELNSSINANVTCNTITGDYTTGTTGTTNGIYSTQSINSGISCNTINNTYRGLFFGGVNPQTLLRGNEMNNHFNGLYLNNVAVIGQQPHRGNRWNGPFTSFGAVNMAPPQLVSGSTFYVDSLLGAVYNPTVNVAGWFKSNSGSTFYCNQQVALCNQSPATLLTLDSLEAMIASGTLETTEYLEETKAISNEYLYRMLVEDSLLMQQDSVYVAFMAENAGNAVAYLNNTEEYLRAASTFDSLYIHITDSATAQIEYYTDSINGIEDWQNLHPLQSADSMQQIWLDKIAFLNQTIHNLETQRQALRENNLANAELENDLVVNAETPELNTAILNDIEIEYQESDGDKSVLLNYFTMLFNIAQQCPYSGGHAVIRARVLLSAITDSIAYDDDGNCLQNGIYRIANDTTVSQKENNEVVIQPNPAGDYIMVTVKNVNSENCKIEIINNLNQTVLTKQLNCNNQEHIDISKISQGLYAVKIILNNELNKVQKLIIQR